MLQQLREELRDGFFRFGHDTDLCEQIKDDLKSLMVEGLLRS